MASLLFKCGVSQKEIHLAEDGIVEHMGKNIWIVNEHLTTPDLSANGHSRHFTLGLEFIKKGYDVSLITSSYSHNPKRKVNLFGLMRIIDGDIRTLVLKGFKHHKSSSIIRIINWFLFLILFFFAPFTRLPKPDIIVLSSTPMLPVYNVLFFKWLYPNCKFIFETRDLWPSTPKSIGNYSDDSIFIKILEHVERKCYSNADYIVSVLKNSDQHIKTILGDQPFHFKWISNGIDLNGFGNQQKEFHWEELENLPKDAIIIGYAGTIGNANAMEFIVEAFNSNFKNSRYYLAILGEGAEKEGLKEVASGNSNILFFESVKRDYLMSFYQTCDVLYLSWRDVELYKYGIAANKLFEYMYAKKPIMMSCNIPQNIIEEAQCGIITKPENSKNIAEKIKLTSSWSKDEKDQMGDNGYSYLIEHLTYSRLAEDYIAVFEDLNGVTKVSS